MTTTAIMTTKYHESYFTSGCWSTSRPGVFFTTKMDGNLDIWDLLHNHKQPVLSVNLTDSGLYSIRNHNGKYLACGGYDGTVSYVELSGDLSNFVGDEKKAFSEERKAIDEVCFIKKIILMKRCLKEKAREKNHWMLYKKN